MLPVCLRYPALHMSLPMPPALFYYALSPILFKLPMYSTTSRLQALPTLCHKTMCAAVLCGLVMNMILPTLVSPLVVYSVVIYFCFGVYTPTPPQIQHSHSVRKYDKYGVLLQPDDLRQLPVPLIL